MDAEVEGTVEGTLVPSNVVWFQLRTAALSIYEHNREFWVTSPTELITQH